MPPIDPTPHAGEVMHEPDEPTYPEPEPESDDAQGEPSARQPAEDAKPSGKRSGVDPLTHAGRDIAG